MGTQLQGILLESLVLILGGLLSILTAKVLLWISKVNQKTVLEAQKLGDERAITILNDALYRTEDMVRTTVIAFENTIKKGLVEAVRDGELNKDDLECLSSMVKEDVLNQLSKETKEVLTKNITDVNLYIEFKIEEELARLKGQA